jgi:hypothetical protein
MITVFLNPLVLAAGALLGAVAGSQVRTWTPRMMAWLVGVVLTSGLAAVLWALFFVIEI